MKVGGRGSVGGDGSEGRLGPWPRSEGRLGPWARLRGEAKGDEGWRTGAEEVWEGTGRRDDLHQKIKTNGVFKLCCII